MVMTQEPRPTPDLLPCPFCGGEAFVSEDNSGTARWVSCGDCECDGPVCSGLQQVVAAWNSRTALTLTPEQVERARKLIPRLDLCLSATNASQSAIDQAVELLREVVGDE